MAKECFVFKNTFQLSPWISKKGTQRWAIRWALACVNLASWQGASSRNPLCNNIAYLTDELAAWPDNDGLCLIPLPETELGVAGGDID